MTKLVLAVDPGSTLSAYLIWTGKKIVDMGICENKALLEELEYSEGEIVKEEETFTDVTLVIEMPQCFGMAVGKSIFETIFWIGRFCQVWQGEFRRIYRSQVKMHFCNSMRAKDSNIRTAIIDLYGGKEKAIGKKSCPGPFYKVHRDEWSALAIAICFSETWIKFKEVE